MNMHIRSALCAILVTGAFSSVAVCADREPIVIIGGQLKNIPPGDTLSASSIGRTSVANNASLQALSSTTYTSVIRLGYVASGDAPPLVYLPSNSACSLAAGAGDGGSQVPSSDGKCWLANFPSLIDIRFWGAKSDGSASITPAFNAAMAYCVSQKNFTIGGSEAPGCTVYFPAGYFTSGDTLHVAPDVSIIADKGALIQLSASASSGTALLDGQYVAGCATAYDCSLNDQWIEGGTWDCNSVTNAIGFYFPYIQRHVHVGSMHMRNCINGGGYVLIGNNGVIIQDNGAWFYNMVLENSTSSSVASGNYGFAFVGTGLIDAYFNNIMVEDTYTPWEFNESFDLHFTNIHSWNFTVCMNEAFHFVGTLNGQDFLNNIVTDGPLCNATSAYGFDHGGPYIADSLRYDAASLPGLPGTNTYGVFVGAGVSLTNVGMQLNGSSSVAIAGDYSNGLVTTLSTIGEVTSNVTATIATCAALPSGGACNIK